jgi:hypothetical protein
MRHLIFANDIYWTSTTSHPTTTSAYTIANASKVIAATVKPYIRIKIYPMPHLHSNRNNTILKK